MRKNQYNQYISFIDRSRFSVRYLGVDVGLLSRPSVVSARAARYFVDNISRDTNDTTMLCKWRLGYQRDTPFFGRHFFGARKSLMVTANAHEGGSTLSVIKSLSQPASYASCLVSIFFQKYLVHFTICSVSISVRSRTRNVPCMCIRGGRVD